MNNFCIFFKQPFYEKEEYNNCIKYFDVYQSRMLIPKNNIVICRYSMYPYYLELENDLKYNNSKLINSYYEYKFIASFDYYDVVKNYTPKTWFEQNFHLCNYDGPFVVKGKTKSKKENWNQLMFAETKEKALDIAKQLRMFEENNEGIIFREYIPLKTFEKGINGIPFSNEWRFFFLKNNLIDFGYYWSIAENIDHKIKNNGIEFAKNIANIIKDYCTFFVLDIAETINGDWILIEINEGQNSGLSTIDPDSFYSKLFKAMNQISF